jgi:hypothetical protein
MSVRPHAARIVTLLGVVFPKCADQTCCGSNLAEGKLHGPDGTPGTAAQLFEFIDENGSGPGVRLRKRHQKKS